MITLHDMNQSWVVPEGFEFQHIEPRGAFLVVTYHQRVFAAGTRTQIRTNVVVVYLNDQGREVERTVASYLVANPPPAPEPKPVAARFKFWNGFLIALQGIGEMLTCLKSS